MVCAAARGLANSVVKALAQFYRHLQGRIGGLATHVAVAHKLALLSYRLWHCGLTYWKDGGKNYRAGARPSRAQQCVLAPSLGKS